MSTWFRETRLSWIAESASIFGFIRRDHIVKTFGVSVPQASQDIQLVLARQPDLLRYDLSQKCYVLLGGEYDKRAK